MIRLKKENVLLQGHAADKTSAITLAGELLVKNGNIQRGYIGSMLNREAVANTYLGKGIAIPHGLPKDREMILQTGISVLQIPEGVLWNPGETVYLVVGIAAKSDEHIEILTNLTHVLDDEAVIAELSQTHDADQILQRLTTEGAREEEPIEPDYEKYFDAVIRGKHGLHARPATVFASKAKQFDSDVKVRWKSQTANGKSLISLLQLGVESGGQIRVSAHGTDEDAALNSLKEAIDAGLEEEEQEDKQDLAIDWDLRIETHPIPGIVASPGLAIGPVFQFRHGKMIVESVAKDPAVEKTKLQQALESAKVELSDLYDSVKAHSGEGRAAIFLAHREFLEDPESVKSVLHLIEQGHSAGWSWQQTFEEKAMELQKLNDALLSARAADLRDVGRRVLKLLADKLEDVSEMPKHPFILIAEDLTPSDTASLDPLLTYGFCTAGGGPTSHSAIIARSLDIPAIVGAGPSVLNLEDGTLCILDGQTGNLYPNPSEPDIHNSRKAQERLREVRESEKLSCYQPAIMTDGHRIEVVANIVNAEDALQAVNAGAEGVGLMRTEFLFLNRLQPPTEEEQYQAYVDTVKALNGLPLIIRTLDIGGDKEISYLNLPKEENPFLGVRGIRLCFVRPDLFETQLRAIYRASKYGPVKIMFPMISTLADVVEAKRIARRIGESLGAEPVEFGIMIEVPAAVVMAPELAREVEFFSIGTNDLTQYVLAMDRGHPVLAKQADGLDPAVLRMIDQTVRAASTAGKWVGVCGGIAGDPQGAAILAGLGVAELSVSIPSIAAIKARIRRISRHQSEELARRALACTNAAEVRALK